MSKDISPDSQAILEALDATDFGEETETGTDFHEIRRSLYRSCVEAFSPNGKISKNDLEVLKMLQRCTVVSFQEHIYAAAESCESKQGLKTSLTTLLVNDITERKELLMGDPQRTIVPHIRALVTTKLSEVFEMNDDDYDTIINEIVAYYDEHLSADMAPFYRSREVANERAAILKRRLALTGIIAAIGTGVMAVRKLRHSTD